MDNRETPLSLVLFSGTDDKLSAAAVLAVGAAAIASPQELLETARDMGVKLVPCQMTMDLMGLTKDDLIEGIQEPAGATTALAAAEGATTLFI
jgi:peroxiredoxin family protein